MHIIPKDAPQDLYDAFAYLGSLTRPTLDDLKLTVLLEAAGKAMYDHFAASVSHPAMQALLSASGRDELAHARRVSRAIGLLTGADYPVPEREENPYLVGWLAPTLTKDLLENLAEAEFRGEDMYGQWAEGCENAAVAELFRQNGREESLHGERLKTMSHLMAA